VLLLGGQIGQGDIGPLSGEGDRDGGSDSRVRAGDERPAAAKPACAGVAVLTAICAGNEVGVESRFRLVLLRRCDVGISSGGVLEGQLVGHRLLPCASEAPARQSGRSQEFCFVFRLLSFSRASARSFFVIVDLPEMFSYFACA